MIIGITGEKGAGKTTIAEYLETKGFTSLAFAEPLKQIASIFGFTDHQLYGTQSDKTEINEQLGICAREFLQKFGTEICREMIPIVIPEMNLGSSGIIWIKLLQDKIEKIIQTNNDIVVSDVRFADEADSLREMGAIIINVKRIERIGRFDIYSDHLSETESHGIDYDFEIINNLSFEDLYKKIDEIIIEIEDNKINKSLSFIRDSLDKELLDFTGSF